LEEVGKRVETNMLIKKVVRKWCQWKWTCISTWELLFWYYIL